MPPHAAEQGDELAPSHGLLWDEANKLPHHWTMWAPCIAAKYSRLCRFRLMAEAGPSLTRRAVRSTPESSGTCGRDGTYPSCQQPT